MKFIRVLKADRTTDALKKSVKKLNSTQEYSEDFYSLTDEQKVKKLVKMHKWGENKDLDYLFMCEFWENGFLSTKDAIEFVNEWNIPQEEKDKYIKAINEHDIATLATLSVDDGDAQNLWMWDAWDEQDIEHFVNVYDNYFYNE